MGGQSQRQVRYTSTPRAGKQPESGSLEKHEQVAQRLGFPTQSPRSFFFNVGDKEKALSVSVCAASSHEVMP